MYAIKSDAYGSSRIAHDEDFDVHFWVASRLWPRLWYTNYTSEFPDPSAILYRPGYKNKRGTRSSRRFSHRKRLCHLSNPWSLFVMDTEPATVAPVSRMPLPGHVWRRTRSRLTAASSSLHTSYSRRSVSTPSVSRYREASTSHRTANGTVIGKSSQLSLVDTDGPAVPGLPASAGPASVARAATAPLANRVFERPGTSPGLLPSCGALLASDDLVPRPARCPLPPPPPVRPAA